MSEFQTEIGYDESFNQASSGMQKFFMKVFAWMFLGLLTTAAVAYGLIAYAPYSLLNGLVNYYIVVFGVELVLVWVLSAKVMQLQPIVAKLMFLAYACMNAVMLVVLTGFYGKGTILIAFAISCVFFGIMAIIGAVTKADLTKMGPMLMAGLVAIIVLSILNMFLRLDGLDFILCVAGLGLFFALTAYDINKLKKVYYSVVQGNTAVNVTENIAIIGALTLYLDFINIFVRIVQLLGRRR